MPHLKSISINRTVAKKNSAQWLQVLNDLKYNINLTTADCESVYWQVWAVLIQTVLALCSTEFTKWTKTLLEKKIDKQLLLYMFGWEQRDKIKRRLCADVLLTFWLTWKQGKDTLKTKKTGFKINNSSVYRHNRPCLFSWNVKPFVVPILCVYMLWQHKIWWIWVTLYQCWRKFLLLDKLRLKK